MEGSEDKENNDVEKEDVRREEQEMLRDDEV